MVICNGISKNIGQTGTVTIRITNTGSIVGTVYAIFSFQRPDGSNPGSCEFAGQTISPGLSTNFNCNITAGFLDQVGLWNVHMTLFKDANHTELWKTPDSCIGFINVSGAAGFVVDSMTAS